MVMFILEPLMICLVVTDASWASRSPFSFCICRNQKTNQRLLQKSRRANPALCIAQQLQFHHLSLPPISICECLLRGGL